MTKGAPKVTVRVDHDDPDIAAAEAVRVYMSTVSDLTDWLSGDEISS